MSEEPEVKPGWLRRICRGCWLLPLAVFLSAFSVVLTVCTTEALYSWSGGEEWCRRLFTVVALVVWTLVVAVWLGALVWLVVQTLRRRSIGHVLRCWGCMAAAVLASIGFFLGILPFFAMEDRIDWYTLGIEIPEGREFVAPRGLREVQGEVKPPAARAQALLDLRPNRRPLEVLVQLPPLPNLEKLTREAPELLQEYMLRCLYAEAVNPRFDAQVLAHGHEPVALVHANDPQGHMLQTLAGGAWIWSMPLHHGWSVVMPAQYQYSPSLPFEEEVSGPLRLLEESLAPLAANPTRSGLDALLSPLPQKPFLSLWNAGWGAYRALVVLPAGYPAGSIELKVRELTTGKRVDVHVKDMPIVPLSGVCSVALDSYVLVESGDLNEFYATEWEIWYTPEAGGESRCLGRQEFLLMGAPQW